MIAVAGGAKKDLLQKSISKPLEQMILNRNNIIAEKNDGQFIPVTAEDTEEYYGETLDRVFARATPSALLSF